MTKMRFSRNSARVHGADGEVIGEGEASPKHPPPSTLGQKFPLPFGAGEKSPPLRRWGKISSPLSPCRASGAILTVYTLHHLSFPLPRQRRDFLNLNFKTACLINIKIVCSKDDHSFVALLLTSADKVLLSCHRKDSV